MPHAGRRGGGRRRAAAAQEAGEEEDTVWIKAHSTVCCDVQELYVYVYGQMNTCRNSGQRQIHTMYVHVYTYIYVGGLMNI